MRKVRPSAGRIDASLFDAVQYLSLLHREGAYQHEAVASLARYAPLFGPAAEEFGYAVSSMHCGMCMHDALLEMGRTTKSRRLREFAEGYAAAVRVCGSAVPFLSAEAERMEKEREVSRKRYLSSLGVFSEMYLVLFVAAPVCSVIAGMIFGMLAESGEVFLELTAYLLLPLGTAAFLLVIDSIGEGTVRQTKLRDAGGRRKQEKWERLLQNADRRHSRREFFRHPAKVFLENPDRVYLASLPAGVMFALPFTDMPFLWTAVFLLIVFVPFAVFHTVSGRRRAAAEAALPGFCRRTADAVLQGMPAADALHLAAAEDVSPLAPEFLRLSGDIRFGDPVSTALFSFADRCRLPAAEKLAVILTEASRFSPDVSGALLRFADDLSAKLLADGERKSGMAPYTAVMYLGYLVFLLVSVILLSVFLETLAPLTGMESAGYAQILIHAVLIHGICTGAAAGKIGEGSVFAGIKHACILFAAGVLVFLILAFCGILPLP